MSEITNIQEAVFKKEIIKKLNKPEFKNTGFQKTISDNYALNDEKDAYVLKEGLNDNTTNKIITRQFEVQNVFQKLCLCHVCAFVA